MSAQRLSPAEDEVVRLAAGVVPKRLDRLLPAFSVYGVRDPLWPRVDAAFESGRQFLGSGFAPGVVTHEREIPGWSGRTVLRVGEVTLDSAWAASGSPTGVDGMWRWCEEPEAGPEALPLLAITDDAWPAERIARAAARGSPAILVFDDRAGAHPNGAPVFAPREASPVPVVALGSADARRLMAAPGCLLELRVEGTQLMGRPPCLVLRIPGKDSSKRVVVSGWALSERGGPGASEAAAAAALLGAARSLSWARKAEEVEPWPFDVVFVLAARREELDLWAGSPEDRLPVIHTITLHPLPPGSSSLRWSARGGSASAKGAEHVADALQAQGGQPGFWDAAVPNPAGPGDPYPRFERATHWSLQFVSASESAPSVFGTSADTVGHREADRGAGPALGARAVLAVLGALARTEGPR